MSTTALQLKQRAVQQAQLSSRMSRPLRQPVDILRQRHKPLHPTRQLRERLVRGIRLHLQRPVTPIIVEPAKRTHTHPTISTHTPTSRSSSFRSRTTGLLPHASGVARKGLRRGERDGVVRSPETPGAAEGRESAGGGEAGAEESEHAPGLGEVRVERGEGVGVEGCAGGRGIGGHGEGAGCVAMRGEEGETM